MLYAHRSGIVSAAETVVSAIAGRLKDAPPRRPATRAVTERLEPRRLLNNAGIHLYWAVDYSWHVCKAFYPVNDPCCPGCDCQQEVMQNNQLQGTQAHTPQTSSSQTN